MIIYLIRHGKTKGTEQHLYCGATNLPLSDNGRKELEENGRSRTEALKLDGFRYMTSGMRRCNETLKLLFGDVDYQENPEFREISFGIFEMHNYEELKDRADYQKWLDEDPEQTAPPEGESGEAVRKRVLHAFDELVQEKEDTVLVSHGGVISTIMEYLFPEEEKNRYEWQPKPGEGYRLEQTAAGGFTYQKVMEEKEN